MQHLNFQAYFQMHLLNFLSTYSCGSVLIVCFVHFKLHIPAKRLKIKSVTNLQMKNVSLERQFHSLLLFLKEEPGCTSFVEVLLCCL